MDNAVRFGVRVKQGKRGEYWPLVRRRVFDEDDNVLEDNHHATIGMGFATKRQAYAAASDMLNGEWEWLD